MDTPLVSVCLITYNHAKYIRNAIDGVLMQKINFTWEFIIADDFSTDGTREIIMEYCQKHPSVIKIIFQPHNVGPGPNYLELLGSAKGKYIAYFEGDDYWIDDRKLQKQFDFLESNKECALCFHRIYDRYDDQKIHEVGLVPPNRIDKTIYTIENLAVNNFIPSLSVFFKNGLIETYPEWYLKCPAGDYATHMLNAKKGKIGFIPEFMGVYRRHAKGHWSLKAEKYQFEKLLLSIDYLEEEFRADGRIVEILDYQYARYCASLSEIEFKAGNKDEALGYIKQAFSRSEAFMNDWLEKSHKQYQDVLTSKEYKIGWALRNPRFMIKRFNVLVKRKK